MYYYLISGLKLVFLTDALSSVKADSWYVTRCLCHGHIKWKELIM